MGTRKLMAASAVAVLGMVTAGACAPDPGPAPARDAWDLHLGCYSLNGADVRYTGPKDTLGNARYLESTDGSCSGVAWDGPAGSNSLVEAADFVEAYEKCNALDDSIEYIPAEADFFPGENAWTCIG